MIINSSINIVLFINTECFTVCANGAPKKASKRKHLNDDQRPAYKPKRRYQRSEREGAPSPESSDDEFGSTHSSPCGKKSDSGSSSNSDSDSGMDTSRSSYKSLKYCDKRSKSCPRKCPCRTGYKKKKLPKMPRNKDFRTITPLYKKFMKKRLLNDTNMACCLGECCEKWKKKKRSVKHMMSHYHSSDLKLTQYPWGQWKPANH